MAVTYLPPDILKKKVFELIDECRVKLAAGHVDIAEVETSVRAYCESIATLPLEEGRLHRDSLHILMETITKLGDELKIARDKVVTEIASLENMRKASNAYYSGKYFVEGDKDGQ